MSDYTDTQLKQGDKIGRWQILSVGIIQSGRRYCDCICECGTRRNVRERSLINGDTVSCGCHRKEVARKMFTIHGGSKLPEYSVWESMRQRCNDKNCECYPNYGGRGIRVCERWDSFENFLYDMGKRPSKYHSIERLDNECNYYPANCVWATQQEQQNNKRNNIRITANGITNSLLKWSQITGISYDVLYWRYKHGWTSDEIVNGK